MAKRDWQRHGTLLAARIRRSPVTRSVLGTALAIPAHSTARLTMEPAAKGCPGLLVRKMGIVLERNLGHFQARSLPGRADMDLKFYVRHLKNEFHGIRFSLSVVP